MTLLLNIELVPSTCWFSNVRDHVSEKDWNIIKKYTFNKANYHCEICSGVGSKWPVECHEIWKYDDQLKIQSLIGTIALCPDCHLVKHIGYSSVIGKFNDSKSHFSKINNLTYKQADKYISEAFEVFHERSKYDWKIDFSWLEKQFSLKIKSKR